MRRLLACIVILSLGACSEPSNQPPDQQPGLAVAEALGASSAAELDGYARALEIPDLEFPRDHNAHPAFRNEWWYFTGNLSADDGREFGYQVTLFRIALAPQPDQTVAKRTSNWATNQIWMAHAAITDRKGQRHHERERFSRGAVGLAGNTAQPFRVWLEDWQIVGSGDEFPWQITIRDEDFGIDLQVSPTRDITLQGDRGLSQKGVAPGNASYYYSITRLHTEGVIRLQDDKHAVTGLSWLDREWSSSALDENQVGWDWFSLQLDSGEDLMYYQLRQRDNGIDPLSRGSWLDGKGQQLAVLPDDVELEPLEYWQSESGARYPVRWRMRLANPARDWIIAATVPDQLMNTIVEYWEGAVDILDPQSGERVGRGYLEMTGYGLDSP